ncbi:MAG: hypothetical protein H7A21_18825 [Spirochaetales bacterium]|nr:hypothetical protein [Leptospiraceae bacterium]MCP5483498.1 hypothetical protein [Spirochaetales bacterium]MCP5486750.1 hypothetical protein [Spirochaetales bacterium]
MNAVMRYWLRHYEEFCRETSLNLSYTVGAPGSLAFRVRANEILRGDHGLTQYVTNFTRGTGTALDRFVRDLGRATDSQAA